jgi:hypothetical protein
MAQHVSAQLGHHQVPVYNVNGCAIIKFFVSKDKVALY